MRYLSIIFIVFLLSYQLTSGQENKICDISNEALQHVSNFKWDEYGKSILVSVGSPNLSPYLHLWVSWDLETNESTFVTTPFTVDILNIAMEYELYSENIMTPRGFFGYSGYLDVSPNELNAIFLKNNAHDLGVYDLYVLDLTNQLSSPNLIQSLQKEINGIRWYDDNHIIVITSPEYGYQSYKTHLICLDGSCNYEITDTERLGYLVNGNPYININQGHLLFLTDYDNDEIYLRIYDIPNQGFIYENRIPNIFSLYLSPRMVEGDTGIYFLHDDHIYRAEYLSNEIVKIGNVQHNMASDWLIMPENRFIVIRETTGIRILCY